MPGNEASLCVAAWPSGLRCWFKVPVILMAWIFESHCCFYNRIKCYIYRDFKEIWVVQVIWDQLEIQDQKYV